MSDTPSAPDAPEPPADEPAEPDEGRVDKPDAWWPADPDEPPAPTTPVAPDPMQPGYAWTPPPQVPPTPGEPPAYGQPPGYAQPQWAPTGPPPPGWGFQPQPVNDGMAVGALVCGIIGALCGLAGVCGVLIAPVGIGLGIASRAKIARSNGRLKGEGMALAGIILGVIGTVVSIIWIVVLLANPDILKEIQDNLTTTTTRG